MPYMVLVFMPYMVLIFSMPLYGALAHNVLYGALLMYMSDMVLISRSYTLFVPQLDQKTSSISTEKRFMSMSALPCRGEVKTETGFVRGIVYGLSLLRSSKRDWKRPCLAWDCGAEGEVAEFLNLPKFCPIILRKTGRYQSLFELRKSKLCQ